MESPLALEARARLGHRPRKTLSVVIPVYHNEESLPELFVEMGKVERELEARGVQLELIFVDDGSGDRSWARLLELKARRPATKLVKLTKNFGSVASSKTGVHFVTGDAFMILAADLQDPPEMLMTMVDRWLAGEKYVVAVREKRADSLGTRFFARIYYWLIRKFAVESYPRGGYDVALMTAEFLP
jgi:dolichol-phosphate mannosyltransferase